MVLPNSLPEVKSIHAYAAVVALGVTFTLTGAITELQLAIVALVFGFIALIDTLGDLLVSLDRVIRELNDVNNEPRDRDENSDR